MAIPLIVDNAENQASGIVGRFSPETLAWSDEFNGNDIDPSRWTKNRLENDRFGDNFERLNLQPNVSGHDDDGNVVLNSEGKPKFSARPQGKRHAIWMNGHEDKTLQVANGRVRLAGYASDERDPTIDTVTIPPGESQPAHPYFDPRPNVNATIDLRNKLFGPPFLQGAIAYADGSRQNEKRIDPAFPAHMWKFCYVEFALDMRGMKLGSSFRFSFWFLPYCHPTRPELYILDSNGNSTGYNGNAADGAEIDAPEVERGTLGFDQAMLSKVIDGGPTGDDAGNPPELEISYAGELGIDLYAQINVFGLWWDPEKIVWYLNGRQTNRDNQRIPKVGMTPFLTREANTGVHFGRDIEPILPYRQGDPGLYADNVGKDVSLFGSDYVDLSYFRVWTDPALEGSPADPDAAWRSEDTIGKIDPATPGGEVAGDVSSTIDISGNWRLVDSGSERPDPSTQPPVVAPSRRGERRARIRHSYSVSGSDGYMVYEIENGPPPGTPVVWNYSSWAGRAVPVGRTDDIRLVLRIIAEPSSDRVVDTVTAAYQD